MRVRGAAEETREGSKKHVKYGVKSTSGPSRRGGTGSRCSSPRILRVVLHAGARAGRVRLVFSDVFVHLRYRGAAVLLCNCGTVALPSRAILRYCGSTVLQYCDTVAPGLSLYYSATDPHYYTTMVLPYWSTTALEYYDRTVLRYNGTWVLQSAIAVL